MIGAGSPGCGTARKISLRIKAGNTGVAKGTFVTLDYSQLTDSRRSSPFFHPLPSVGR